MKVMLWMVCVAAVAGCGTIPSDDHAGRFQGELDRVRAEFGFPGMTAAYVLNDGSSGTVASGMADLEAGEPMTVHSRMRGEHRQEFRGRPVRAACPGRTAGPG
ncbi:hypothetical protein [Thioalkalivibrio sulfidiphilus]|uniref:hypothetical protein n=1 Tax=Thioalkalivibrio sulfidiphilus TaxID=1033854 RepID=UPI0012DE1E28|nr:hypothetical protein [Thioalkalivibrio sulfidiphilus]